MVVFRKQHTFDIDAHRSLGAHFGPLHKHATYAVPRRGDLDDVVGMSSLVILNEQVKLIKKWSTRIDSLDLILMLFLELSFSIRMLPTKFNLLELLFSSCTLLLRLETILSGLLGMSPIEYGKRR